MQTSKHFNKKTTSSPTDVDMLRCLNVKMSAGFTILELLVSITVVTIGVLGAYSVAQQMFVSSFSTAHHLTAAYLAKEGIEIVRNARDTNWVEDNDNWRDGISSSNWESTDIANYERRTTITYNDPRLEVVVDVRWDVRGDDGQVTVQENLYGWK